MTGQYNGWICSYQCRIGALTPAATLGARDVVHVSELNLAVFVIDHCSLLRCITTGLHEGERGIGDYYGGSRAAGWAP
jgi:hypothetical protein